MIVVLSDPAAVAVSTVVWPAMSVVIGWWGAQWPLERLAHAGPLTRLRPWEDQGAWWQRLVRVQQWKDRLPEAGALFGGVTKRRLRSSAEEGLERFALETVRAERVHWLLMASASLHLVWCRPAVGAGMLLFGVAFNAPFIIVQRANRGRVQRVLHRRAARK